MTAREKLIELIKACGINEIFAAQITDEIDQAYCEEKYDYGADRYADGMADADAFPKGDD